MLKLYCMWKPLELTFWGPVLNCLLSWTSRRKICYQMTNIQHASSVNFSQSFKYHYLVLETCLSAPHVFLFFFFFFTERNMSRCCCTHRITVDVWAADFAGNTGILAIYTPRKKVTSLKNINGEIWKNNIQHFFNCSHDGIILRLFQMTLTVPLGHFD